MMNITESKYFFFGAAKILSHGDEEKLLQYALYNPIIDRIVIVHYNYLTLKLISLLFSSRYQLILCRIDRSKNWTDTLITNDVIDQWTMDTLNILFTRFPSYSDKIFEPTELLNVTPISIEDREYILAAATWIEFLNEVDRFGRSSVNYYEDVLYNLLPFKNPKKELVLKIYEIIYKEFNFAAAEEKINQLIETYEYENISKLNICIDRLC
jgi:hypothetical protein